MEASAGFEAGGVRGVVPLSHNLNEVGFGVDRGRIWICEAKPAGSQKLTDLFSLIKSPHEGVRLEHVI
jgi:hypothetical protein